MKPSVHLNPVSIEQCREFDGYMKKWQELLNLTNWRVERSSRRSKTCMSAVKFNDAAMLATYYIGEHFGSAEVNAESLEDTAVHELLHVLLRKFKLDQSEANEHEVINVLEKLLIKAARASHD